MKNFKLFFVLTFLVLALNAQAQISHNGMYQYKSPTGLWEQLNIQFTYRTDAPFSIDYSSANRPSPVRLIYAGMEERPSHREVDIFVKFTQNGQIYRLRFSTVDNRHVFCFNPDGAVQTFWKR